MCIRAGLTLLIGAQATPTYMAPELFQAGGVHSSASDLWAMGCVLYECASGRPPFVSPSFKTLVHLVLTAEPSPLPPGAVPASIRETEAGP